MDQALLIPSAKKYADNVRSDLFSDDINKGASIVKGVARVVDSIDELKQLDKTKTQKAFQTGYYESGDGAGGSRYCDLSDTTTPDNGGTVIVANDGGRWKLSNPSGTVNPRQFGAKCDGVTPDGDAWLKMAATGLPISGWYGVTVVDVQVTISASLIGFGADLNQSEILLTGAGQLVVGDSNCHWSLIRVSSSVNGKTFIVNNGVSYWTFDKFVLIGSNVLHGQVGIHFNTNSSIYQNYVTNWQMNEISYPFLITNDGSFNNNTLGNSRACYAQFFLSAIRLEGTGNFDANHVCGYFEGGTNFVNRSSGSFRANVFDVYLDAVTNTINNGASGDDQNVWILANQEFINAGTKLQNQVLVGPKKTKIRATSSAAQVIDNAQETTITYNSEAFDELSEFDAASGVFTPKRAGYYHIDAGILTESVAWGAGQRIEIRITKNDVIYARGDYSAVDAAVTRSLSSKVAATVYMNGTTDFLKVRALHNRGADTALESESVSNYVNIVWCD